MADQLLLLFAALLALLTAGPATALATAPADSATGAQILRPGLRLSRPTHAPAPRSESSCTRPGSILGSAQIAAGCCVAQKAGGLVPKAPASLGRWGESRSRRFSGRRYEASFPSDDCRWPASTPRWCCQWRGTRGEGRRERRADQHRPPTDRRRRGPNRRWSASRGPVAPFQGASDDVLGYQGQRGIPYKVHP